MMYLINDKHGFNHEVLEIQPDTLTKFQVQEELDYFMRVRMIKNITDFDIQGFQKYLFGKYHIQTKSVRPLPLNLQV